MSEAEKFGKGDVTAEFTRLPNGDIALKMGGQHVRWTPEVAKQTGIALVSAAVRSEMERTEAQRAMRAAVYAPEMLAILEHIQANPLSNDVCSMISHQIKNVLAQVKGGKS